MEDEGYFSAPCPQCNELIEFNESYASRDDPFECTEGMCVNCAVVGYSEAKASGLTRTYGLLDDGMSLFGINGLAGPDKIELCFVVDYLPKIYRTPQGLESRFTYTREEVEEISAALINYLG
tara:strand:- start:121 stop:486 length:366 start_codon:yes stop_codon:yes gene_type:complete